ncbi:acetate/propionate family kinase [Teredinibacter haidensis]|uniref:acetate/propionate family kinase n=1 Tax=Teredinibacter haidensis TaxID=2731755 RepID=UPI0009489C1B|nr:acetate kinase [Teredinibacter haidensis]
MQYVLVFNSGSSSFKFSLFSTDSTAALEQTPLLNGLAERLNTPEAAMRLVAADGSRQDLNFPADHQKAIETLVEKMPEFGLNFADVAVVGHRVVHGGERFSESVLICDKAMEDMRACSELAPLHNPANILGIELIRELYPELPQVAVFDTAFHQTLPRKAFLYPIPYSLYRDHGIRRYGFHGTSHRYVSETAIKQLELSEDDNQLLVAHLGNGCSATAVVNGKSVDTTMGLTPLEGLVMGTRSGDVDPSLHQYLQETLGWSLSKITDMLNRESGLLGLSELSNDMRTLYTAAEDEDHEGAALAIEVFCFRLARQLAALATSLTRIDALVFTGGIGEHNASTRTRVLEQLAIFGFNVDLDRNEVNGETFGGVISCEGSTVAMVVKTNEEAMIARDALLLVGTGGGQ